MDHDLDTLTLRKNAAPSGLCELVADAQHLDRVIHQGLLQAKVSVDIMTADFKAMLIPTSKNARNAPSIVAHLLRLAQRGIEIRLLHAGVPSRPALQELKKASPFPKAFQIRRCPRLHAKTVIIDAAAMYLGSANLTGAGLGAKSDRNRNFEMGVWTTAPDMIEPVSESFNALWEGDRCKNCGRHDVCPVPLESPALK